MNQRSAWAQAARSLGIDPEPLHRPGPARWLWYAFWGPLPRRYRLWVLYDGTCSTWALRNVARIVAVVALPVAALATMLPASTAVRLEAALTAGLLAVLYTAVWTNEGVERRLESADWAAQTCTLLRERRSEFARHGQQ